jgi:hypothetical protein
MNDLFLFQTDEEITEAIRTTPRIISIHMIHPDIVKGFVDRQCDTFGFIYCDNKFIYAQQLNGLYTKVSISDH